MLDDEQHGDHDTEATVMVVMPKSCRPADRSSKVPGSIVGA